MHQVESTDSGGNTPLHLAVLTGSIPMVQVGTILPPTISPILPLPKAVLVFGGDWRARNGEGDTPWSLALKTFQSKFGFANVEKERNLVLHCLHAVGAEGPADATPGARDFDWKPPVTDKNMLGKRTR